HIDDGDAELALVLDEAGEARSIRADDDSRGLEMAAADAVGEIAHRRELRGNDVHVDGELLAEKAARVAQAASAIDREADRDRVNHGAVGHVFDAVALVEHTLHQHFADLAAIEREFRFHEARAGKAAGDVDHGLADRPARHLLGRVDAVEDRAARRFDIDDHTVADASRDLVADADDPWLAVLKLRDEARNFRRADIDGGKQPAARANIHLGHVFGLACAGLPFLMIDFATSGGTRSTRRSGSRISTTCTLRSRSLSLRSSAARRCHAFAALLSGSDTTMPLSRWMSQRRPPTRTEAVTCACSAGS